MMETSKFILVAERDGVTLTFCKSCRDLVMNTARDIQKHVQDKRCFTPGYGEVESLITELSAAGHLIANTISYNTWMTGICTQFATGVEPLAGMAGDI